MALPARKVALVTGSGKRRIGWHVADALAGAGYDLVVHYHTSATEAAETVRHLQGKGAEAIALAADLSDEQAVRGVITGTLERFGRIDGPGLVALLKKYKELGARGFGEHQVGLPFDHPLMMDVYAACEKVELPILFHLDDIRGIDTPGLPRLEHALKTYPKLNFIGHACGFWASISADAKDADFSRYPKIPTPVVPGGALERLLAKYPNLYCDLSEPGGHLAIARDRKFGREFVIRWADRLLFGTDVLMSRQEIPQFDLYDSLDLPDEVQYKIYRGNAIKLLKLEGAK